MNLFQVLFIIGLGCLVASGIFYLIYKITDEDSIGCITIVFTILYVVLFIIVIIGNEYFKPLPEEYQEKIKAIEDAQKDLQKFLIDHPEFREVEDVL